MVFDRLSSSVTRTIWSHSGQAPPRPRLRPNRLQSGHYADLRFMPGGELPKFKTDYVERHNCGR